MNTETVTVHQKGEDFEITVHDDQSGSAYGMTLSKNAYEQLRQHFFSGSLPPPKCKCGQNALPYKAQIETKDAVFELIEVQETNPCRHCAFSRYSMYKKYCGIYKCKFNPSGTSEIYKFLNKNKDVNREQDKQKIYKAGVQLKLDLF